MQNKKTVLTALAILFFTTLSLAQNASVTGNWKGEWSNHQGFHFKFSLDLKEDSLRQLSGTFNWKLIKSPRPAEQRKLGRAAVEYVQGKYDPATRKLILKGTGKEDPHLIIGIDNYDLQLSVDGRRLEGKTENHGSWKGVFYGFRPAGEKDRPENYLQLAGREILTTRQLRVSSPTLQVLLWDNNKEDGDIISLNLNGEWILKDHLVRRSKEAVVLELRKGENFLILHAENLGEIEPNTAAISVLRDGKESLNITLNSDMGMSEAIRILRD